METTPFLYELDEEAREEGVEWGRQMPGLLEKPDHGYQEGHRQCSGREYSDTYHDHVLIVCLRLIGFLHHRKS